MQFCFFSVSPSLSLSLSLSLCLFSLFFLVSLTAGAAPPERHETQPFRTKWTLDVQNQSKLRFWYVQSTPFARHGRWLSKTDLKVRLWFTHCNPFARRGHWTSKSEIKLRFWCTTCNLYRIYTVSSPFETTKASNIHVFACSCVLHDMLTKLFGFHILWWSFHLANCCYFWGGVLSKHPITPPLAAEQVKLWSQTYVSTFGKKRYRLAQPYHPWGYHAYPIASGHR